MTNITNINKKNNRKKKSTSIPTSLEKSISNFSTYLISKASSENTVKNYASDVRGYFRHHLSLSSSSPPLPLKEEDILSYVQHLQNKMNLNAKSINRKLSSLKKYNEFLIAIGEEEEVSLAIQPHHYISVQQTFSSPTSITSREVSTFLKKIKKHESFRNYAIITLIANTGLRISEVLSIEMDKIRLSSREITVIGKGNKQREVYLTPISVDILREYINSHRKKSRYTSSTKYLFISNKGGKLDTSSIQRVFNKYSDHITAHALRHRFATDMLEKKILDPRQLQQQLGHLSIETVMIYTHPSKSQMKESLDAYSVS